MKSTEISKGIVSAVIKLALITLLLFFIYQIQSVLIYLLVALVISLIGNPITNFLKKRLKFKHTLAVVTTMIIFVLIVGGLLMMFIPLLLSQGQNLSLLNTASLEKDFNDLVFQINSYFNDHNIDAGKLLEKSNWSSKINFDFIPEFLNTLIGTVSSFGVGLASVFFITFFFLKDQSLFIKMSKRILPDQHEDKILSSVEKINVLLSRYFIGLLLQLFIVFILYLIVLLIFGIENAFVIAFLCAVLNIIPYIGPLIGTVLALALTLISNLGGDFRTEMLPTAIYVMIGFMVVQLIDNNISQPIIFSNSIKSHPLEIFLVILIFGLLFGVFGMILAVPFYTVLKVIGKEFFPENQIIKILTKNI
ncbi:MULTISPECIES: AI-2E family transporter [Flavobacterium]|uniref:AI-2E family transporter n=1 Tax=Flavobacterium TaxID=237 RepID=UPI000959F691|nr:MULTISPECIES: AI-2E family transporter [Flavobacterium]MBN9286105.1 AI-2E family transporter [Flavobacterium sp.]OJV67297.1 MAG: AI-2E family transporter [Flavobacterium sp. 40-81]